MNSSLFFAGWFLPRAGKPSQGLSRFAARRALGQPLSALCAIPVGTPVSAAGPSRLPGPAKPWEPPLLSFLLLAARTPRGAQGRDGPSGMPGRWDHPSQKPNPTQPHGGDCL